MTHKEGKKPQGNILEEVKEVYISRCPNCNTALIQLETETGKHYTNKEGIICYNVYWICLCPKGHGKFKVKEGTFKMGMEGK